MATKTTTKTTKTSAKKGRRFNLGTCWETSNSDFMSGSLREAQGQYLNNSWLLEQLGEPAEGMQWRCKVFFKTVLVKDTDTLLCDLVVEEEPIYQR